MAASIPVLRTLFRDLNTMSRKYYNNSAASKGTNTQRSAVMSRHGDQPIFTASAIVSPYIEDVTKSGNSSDKSPVRDSYGQIMQSREVTVTVEYRKDEDGVHFARGL